VFYWSSAKGFQLARSRALRQASSADANLASPFKANAETTFLCTLAGHPPQLRLPLGPPQVHNLPGIATQFESPAVKSQQGTCEQPLESDIEVFSFHIAQGLLAANASTETGLSIQKTHRST